MAAESVVLAVALVGLSKLVDLGSRPWTDRAAAARRPGRVTGRAPGRVPGGGGLRGGPLPPGARPAVVRVLRGLQTPAGAGQRAAVTASALLFSLAHHAGTPGEAFTWFAFIFRWLAGVYFAWVFVVRGFGVAVGTHTAYDVLVGWLGWHF